MTEEVLKTVEVLKKGGIILYPTDTVWGIGCDATKSKSVERIFRIKKRDAAKSLIVLIDEYEKLFQYVEKVPDIAYDLINSADSPITVVYPDAKNLAENIISEDGSIGIRIVKDEFCKKIINLLNQPIVSTSANISGEPTPLIYYKISQEIINHVDYVVNYNRTRILQLKPSTIVKFNKKGDYHIVRA
jgi:L-threonylcarbamoyladenylate synthase